MAQRERSRMRWISKSISSYGSDERIAFVSLNTSSVNFVASFPSRGSRFLEERTYTPPCGSDACASGKQKPSEKKLFPGRFKSVSFRQTGSCVIVFGIMCSRLCGVSLRLLLRPPSHPEDRSNRIRHLEDAGKHAGGSDQKCSSYRRFASCHNHRYYRPS